MICNPKEEKAIHQKTTGDMNLFVYILWTCILHQVNDWTEIIPTFRLMSASFIKRKLAVACVWEIYFFSVTGRCTIQYLWMFNYHFHIHVPLAVSQSRLTDNSTKTWNQVLAPCGIFYLSPLGARDPFAGLVTCIRAAVLKLLLFFELEEHHTDFGWSYCQGENIRMRHKSLKPNVKHVHIY